jgi:AcrR family transcriptional regulator
MTRDHDTRSGFGEGISGIPAGSGEIEPAADAHVSPDGKSQFQPREADGLRRRPVQERSSVTVDAILQAAAELFCALGYDRASTNRIAERAGVSIGSLYQYFANKEAILGALLERHHREVHAVVEDSLAELENPEVPLDEALELLLTRLVDLHAEDPELTRVLSEEVPHLAHGSADPEEVDHYAGWLVDLLRRRSDVEVRDPVISATLVVTTVEAVTRWLVHGAPPDLDRTIHVREAVVMLTGYLSGRSR